MKRRAVVFGMLLFFAVFCRAQNDSTFGTITAAASTCTPTSCVYFQVPPNIPWVSLTVAGNWSGMLQVQTISSTNATYQTINNFPWTLISTITANSNEAVAVGSARFILVNAVALSTGSAQITMSASQSGTPLSNPVFSGEVTTLGVKAPDGGSSSNCWATDGTELAGCGGSGNAITALTGDVTATGPGSVAATVVAIPPNVTLTSTPSAGYVPTATGSNAATWQGPASSIANCFLPMSTGTLFTASVIDQGCTLASYLNIGGGFGINIPSSSLGITSKSPTTQQHIGTATSLLIAPSTATVYVSEGFNSGLVLAVTNTGTGYASAIRITCTISGGTFSVPATCVAAGATTNSTLSVVINNPGVYSSAAGATIAVSGGAGSGWAGTLSLSGGIPQQDSWSENASYSLNGGTLVDAASSLLSFQFSGRQSTAGSPGIQFINQPIQGAASGMVWNLDAPGNAVATHSMSLLTQNQLYNAPNASGLEMVIVAIVAASNCGSLSGSTGCYQINDGTGTHFIPRF